MKDVGYFTKIFVARDHVDFRKQARGLAVVVKEVLAEYPLQDKTLFVFVNRRKDSIKILYWDATGHALWSKTLEKARFKWLAKDAQSKITLNSRDLKWLLQGVDLTKIKMHEKLTFSETH